MRTETHNLLSLLTNETDEDFFDGNPRSKKIHNPPPLSVRGVINCRELVKRITDVGEYGQYCTKRLANCITEINCVTPDTCRKLVRCCEGNNILYRTYGLEGERGYRIVIKCLHRSTDYEDIRQ